MNMPMLVALMGASLFPAQDLKPVSEIRTLLDAQVKAWNQGDLDGFVSAYWNDDRVTFFSGGDVSKGFKPLRDRYFKRYKAEGKEMGQLAFENLEIEPVGPDFATARGRFRLKMKEDQPPGLFTLWLRKFPDGWKIVHDHSSAAEKK
jgi:beta-aspartyl-peptidase (threonine type)